MIRERVDTDLPRLEEILHTTYERDGYPFRAESVSAGWLVRHGDLAWVLVVDGVVVGHVALHLSVDGGPSGEGSSGDGAEIVRYFVAPEARGTGGASLLLQRALAEAYERAGDAWLVVMPHNTRAVAAYARAGLVPDGETSWTDVEGVEHPLLRFRASGSRAPSIPAPARPRQVAGATSRDSDSGV
nr:GNAT family N-acetyltransferase [Cellulomonas sp. JH27-2]